jgi:CheY-like chemotaxis protein
MDNRKKVLIVDDENISREFFNVMLSRLGFSVEEAFDGIDALEKVKKFHPDIIVLDNIMPRMSGWEVTKTLKNDVKYQDIPIIMLSSLDDVKDKLTGFELGIDDYITKPFNFSEVLARIKTTLRNRELFNQVKVRESRLGLAEELSADLQENLTGFVKSIDELDGAIACISKSAGQDTEGFAALIKSIGEKTQAVRKQIAALDARIEKTILEWDDLKKGEIGLSVLESNIRKFLPQEQED